jgi:hypothetical protein
MTIAAAWLSLNPMQAKAAHPTNYSAQLSGHEEVPPRETNATGHVTFQLGKDGLSLSYRIIVADIDNVTAAQIHLGAREMNGPVVVMLYGPVPAGSGRKSGVLAEGTITSGSLTGDLAGHPLADLVAAVNVHTDDGGGAPNTRSGDFPDGEIRGQIH